MIFLDRTEHETEVMTEKIAVGVPRGEPKTQALTSHLVSAFFVPQ